MNVGMTAAIRDGRIIRAGRRSIVRTEQFCAGCGQAMPSKRKLMFDRCAECGPARG